MIQKLVYKIYKRDSIIIRSGIDIEKFDLSGVEISKDNKEFVILEVGTLCPYKRQKFLIEFMQLLKKERRDIYENTKLILVGPAIHRYKKEVFELAKNLGVDEKVIYTGMVSDDELIKIYASTDVFVFPSYQSWSLVSVEAMAMGKPVIVSNKCGVSEIIKNGETGFVFEHENIRDLFNKIIDLYEDKNKRELIGKNAKKYVRENMSWEKYAENMEKIFERIVL